MPFTELCIYQVKPQKTEEFEALMLEAKSFLEEQEGMLFLRLIKRGKKGMEGTFLTGRFFIR